MSHQNIFEVLFSTYLCWPFVNCIPGLANRTAEKVKPSALDLLLLFRESVRLKQASANGKKAAVRDLLWGSVADYNKTIGQHRASCLILVGKWLLFSS